MIGPAREQPPAASTSEGMEDHPSVRCQPEAAHGRCTQRCTGDHWQGDSPGQHRHGGKLQRGDRGRVPGAFARPAAGQNPTSRLNKSRLTLTMRPSAVDGRHRLNGADAADACDLLPATFSTPRATRGDAIGGNGCRGLAAIGTTRDRPNRAAFARNSLSSPDCAPVDGGHPRRRANRGVGRRHCRPESLRPHGLSIWVWQNPQSALIVDPSFASCESSWHRKQPFDVTCPLLSG